MIPVVWSPSTVLHDPRHEVWVGKQTAGTEVPERAVAILRVLTAAGHPEVAATAHDDAALLAVHEPAMLEWLRTAAQQWAGGPYEAAVGQDRVVPYLFPTAGMTAGMPATYPTAPHARAGVWCYDTMTLVGPGTWEAARGAVDAALTAVDLVVGGAGAAYALCRPPGHHATPAGFGGSCYLNNAAVAAQALTATGRRVAVVDIDAHHGNGTQAVFWQRAEVFYGSVHVDPGAGWFPHLYGFADERGAGPGAGTTVNVPVAPGSGDDPWLEALSLVGAHAIAFGADALVVSLGVDAAAADPESPLDVSRDGFVVAGHVLSGLGLPTVLVQEGGYDLTTIGTLVGAVLSGFTGERAGLDQSRIGSGQN